MAKPPVDGATKLLIERAQKHLAWYMFLVHRTDMADIAGGQAKPAAHHKAMIEVLMNDSLGHSLIVAPRGSGKTTLVQAWLEWRLGRASLEGGDWAQTFRVAYCSNTAHQAYKVSNAIKDTILKNDWYHLIFPKVKPHKERWSEPEWRVQGNTGLHSNFVATGVGGPLLGARALTVVYDDTDDEESMRSQLEREKSRLWHENTAMPVLVPWGRALKICTRWHEDDTAQWAMDQGWHTLYMKAIKEDGASYWEERFHIEELLEMRKRSPMSFALQYQNEVIPAEGVTFKKEWFRNRFDYAPSPEEIKHVFATWDTAGTLTGRSYTVGLVIVITRDWDYQILHMFRGRVEYPDLKRVIRETAKRWRVSATVIESKATGQPVLQELAQEGLRVIPVLPPGQRGGPAQFDWVEQITIPCEEGRVWLPSLDFFQRHQVEPWTETFLGEMLSYPDGSNDDIVVALTQLLFHVERDRKRWEDEDRRRAMEPLRWGDPAESRLQSGRRRKYLARHPEPERKLLV